MTNALYNNGETRVLTAGLQSRAVNIGLYNDSTDTLTDSSTMSGITTEPSGSAYSAQSLTGTSSIALNGSNNGQATYADVTFDTSNSTQSVDSVYIQDSSSGELLFTCALDSTYDLSNIDSFTVQDAGLILD